MRLLVVDDEESIRKLCARFLRGAGHEVELAASGEEAAARLGEPFEIVLTDLGLGGNIDGNELTRRVRKAGNSDVIILTGNPNVETAIQAMRDGAYDYLIKPFTEETVLLAVARCADRRRLSTELAQEKALRRLRETLGQFATPEVAHYTQSHPDDFWKRGELRMVTVMFADVRRFTPFAARTEPREVVRALNEMFGVAIQAVKQEGGIVNKFIGDGMMALFGAPVPLEDHAGAAARAALRALAGLENLAWARKTTGEEVLRFGIGINTGEVVAGCLGNRERTEYSVIGHAVNLGSRLEEAAPPGEILIGPETAKLLAERFVIQEGAGLELAGIPAPVRRRRLVSPVTEVLRA